LAKPVSLLRSSFFFFRLRSSSLFCVVTTLTPMGLCRGRLVGGGADRGAKPDERDSRRTALSQGQPGRGAGHGRPTLAAFHPALSRAAIRQPARYTTQRTRHTRHTTTLTGTVAGIGCTPGLDVLNEHRHRGNYARPRRFELAAAVNRLRTVSMTHLPPPPAHPSNPRG
jgi:hypothetical protein